MLQVCRKRVSVCKGGLDPHRRVDNLSTVTLPFLVRSVCTYQCGRMLQLPPVVSSSDIDESNLKP